jgi:hypothetical protein
MIISRFYKNNIERLLLVSGYRLIWRLFNIDCSLIGHSTKEFNIFSLKIKVEYNLTESVIYS